MITPAGVTKIINKAGTLTSAHQRLVTGVTALALQPAIDLNNKKADEDTRVLAACKSLAKGIACPISGVAVRSFFISKADDICKNPNSFLNPFKGFNIEEVKNYKKLVPDGIKINPNHTFESIPEFMNKYSRTVGNVAAVCVMLFTNFLFDAPLTKQLTNFFYKKVTGKEAE